jgi:hypothetical protein
VISNEEATIVLVLAAVAALVWRLSGRRHTPIDRIPCRVIAKRQCGESLHQHHVSFENRLGTLLEPRVAGSDNGVIAIGDHGTLCLRGSDFDAFQRSTP